MSFLQSLKSPPCWNNSLSLITPISYTLNINLKAGEPAWCVTSLAMMTTWRPSGYSGVWRHTFQANMPMVLLPSSLLTCWGSKTGLNPLGHRNRFFVDSHDFVVVDVTSYILGFLDNCLLTYMTSKFQRCDAPCDNTVILSALDQAKSHYSLEIIIIIVCCSKCVS